MDVLSCKIIDTVLVLPKIKSVYFIIFEDQWLLLLRCLWYSWCFLIHWNTDENFYQQETVCGNKVEIIKIKTTEKKDGFKEPQLQGLQQTVTGKYY